jgi:hypothetical protein
MQRKTRFAITVVVVVVVVVVVKTPLHVLPSELGHRDTHTKETEKWLFYIQNGKQ